MAPQVSEARMGQAGCEPSGKYPTQLVFSRPPKKSGTGQRVGEAPPFTAASNTRIPPLTPH